MTQTIQFSSSYSGCGPYMDLQAREQEDSLLVENLAQLFQNSLLVRHGDGPLGPRVLYEAVKQGKGDTMYLPPYCKRVSLRSTWPVKPKMYR